MLLICTLNALCIKTSDASQLNKSGFQLRWHLQSPNAMSMVCESGLGGQAAGSDSNPSVARYEENT
jgi:hypothetical protein